MSTVIVTPLFPPDPSDSARYTKLLTEKLHPGAVVLFGSLPESVPGVTLYPVSKRTSRLVRALSALWQLRKLKPTTIIVQNGPSSELPVLWYTWLSRARLIYIISDAAEAQNQTGARAALATRLQRNAQSVITIPENPSEYLPPEWLPYREPSASDQERHTSWWDTHLQKITSV